jgi:ribosomal protein S17
MSTVVQEKGDKKIKINFELLKNNPKLILLMKELKKYKINVDDLTENELNKLFECILIISR